MTDEEMMNVLRKFNQDRDWDQFHSGENLAKSICIEAAELLEVFQWDSKEKSIDKVKEELADVLTYCYMMADHYHLDVKEIMMDKMRRNEAKYPPNLCRGSNKKYNELHDKGED